MERIRPYLFWVVLAAVVVVLGVVRFVPIQGVYDKAREESGRRRELTQTLDRYIDKGEDLPRPALVQRFEELAGHYEKVVASDDFHKLVMDYKSEFWPGEPTNERIYIGDFTRWPTDPNKVRQLRVRMVYLREQQQRQIKEVAESIRYDNADPAQDRQHRIYVSPGVVSSAAQVGGARGLAGLAALRAILATQRVLWLRRGLYRVITNPDVDVKAVFRVECRPPAVVEEEKEAPAVGQEGQAAYVKLNWVVQLELPFHKIPVLLSDLERSERHLQVQDFAILALPKTVVDFGAGETPTGHQAEEFRGGGGISERDDRWEEEEGPERVGPGEDERELLLYRIEQAGFRKGHLIRLILRGVSYDFLRLPEDPEGRPRWPT